MLEPFDVSRMKPACHQAPQSRRTDHDRARPAPLAFAPASAVSIPNRSRSIQPSGAPPTGQASSPGTTRTGQPSSPAATKAPPSCRPLTTQPPCRSRTASRCSSTPASPTAPMTRPYTCNTVNRLANGITDTLGGVLVCEADPSHHLSTLENSSPGTTSSARYVKLSHLIT